MLRALIGAVLAASLATTSAADKPVRAQRVAQDVWFVQGEAAMGSSANRNFISNAGFVVTGKGVVVIDALGSPALAQELIAEVRRVTAQPIRYVIVTHFHADHIYGLQAFKAIGATIIAHPAGRAYLNSEVAALKMQASREELFPWIDESTQLLGADRWLESTPRPTSTSSAPRATKGPLRGPGGMSKVTEPHLLMRDESTLRLGAFEFQMRHAGPAHTPEDLVVHVPRRSVLFVGDLAFRGRIPFVGQADSGQWIASLTRLIEFKPRIVIPGHGPVSTQPIADMQLTRDYLKHLRHTMGEAARNLEPFDEAYAKADWSRFERVPLFAAVNRMNAYNTYLLMEQQGR